jgi:hypothetical protein
MRSRTVAKEAAARLKEAIRQRSETPARERFEALVRRGAIDSEGRVLIRSPHVPDDHEASARLTDQQTAGNGASGKRKSKKVHKGKAKKP